MMNSLDQFYIVTNEFVVKYLLKFLCWNSPDLLSIRTLKGNSVIDIVPITAYIGKLFFKSRLCSRSS